MLTEKKKTKRHWILGTKSFVENQLYEVGVEQKQKSVFLDSELNYPVLWKYMLPRYYLALIRNRTWMFNTYDPLTIVRGDHLTFIMRDQSNRAFWEVCFNENCFKEFNSSKGQVFVDFNSDFVSAIRHMSSKFPNSLRVEPTGITYTGEEENVHLPEEDRKTLIKLLKIVYQNMLKGFDEKISVKTNMIWNQSLPRYRDLASLVSPSGFGEEKGFETMFDSAKGSGEVYNPFYVIAQSRSLFDLSKVASYLGKHSYVYTWNDENQYAITIPFVDPNKTLAKDKVLGFIRYKGPGRTNPRRSTWR